MTRRQADVLGVVLVGGAFAITGMFYGRLPDPMPVHWDLQGRPDGFMPKPLGAFLLPVVAAVVWAVLVVLPRLAPGGYSLDPFRRVYDIVRTVIVGFVVLVWAVSLMAAVGGLVRFVPVVMVAVGLLFTVLGNYLGKVQRNFFVGVRTPWALTNDEVWLHTQRAAGKLFVAAGLVLAIAGLLGVGLWVLPAAVGVAVLGSVAVSYAYHRKLVRLH